MPFAVKPDPRCRLRAERSPYLHLIAIGQRTLLYCVSLMQSAPALPLEKLAAIDAKLQAGLPRDRVFADAGVTAETWERAKDAWFARMANEAARGKGRKLHKRYHDLLHAARKAVASDDGQTLVKPKGKAPKAPVARLSPLAAQYRPDAPRVSSPTDVSDAPSGLIRAPGVVAASPAMVSPARESSPGDGRMNGLPFGGTSRPPRAEETPAFAAVAPALTNDPTKRSAARCRKDATLFDMPVDEEHTILHTGQPTARKAPLPFVSKAQTQSSWDETTEPVRSPLRNDPLPFVAAKQHPAATPQAAPPRAAGGNDVLPFVNPQQAASSSSVFAAPVKQPSAPPPLDADPLMQTRAAKSSPQGDGLPFASGRSASSPAPAPTNPAKTAGLPFQQATPHVASGSSAPAQPSVQTGLPFQKAAVPAAAGTRSSSQAPPPNPTEPLDLTRYACLCAELARFPDETERVFARYGLADPHVRASVDATWRARLGQDPQLYRTWQEYFQHYSTQYFGQGRKI